MIDLAEKYHIIDKLGFLIIEQACSAISKLNELGFENISISVNITATQLEKGDFSSQLLKIIRHYQIRPDSIKIEITEQVALENNQKIKDELIAINTMGIELAMDDFGMGHSSLMYLKEYNFDTIKIDGSLVREICSNANCRDIISSIIFLSRSLNYSLLAEYVESAEQRTILHDLGCDQYQGYLFSKALSFENLIEYIKINQCKLQSPSKEKTTSESSAT